MTTLTTALPGANPPEGGWLRAVRQELALTQSTVAKAAGLTQQAYAQFEQGEARGTLSLGNLQRSAAAMDCDVVYFLVPRANRGRPFGELATRIAQDSGPAPAEKSTVPPGEKPASTAASPGFTLNLVQDHHIL